MARRCTFFALLGSAAALPALLLLSPPEEPWPVLVGEAGFRTLLVAHASNDSVAVNASLAANVNASLAAEDNGTTLARLSRDNEYPEELERIREDRIYAIKYQILGFLGFMGGAPVLNASDKEQMEAMREWYSQMRDLPEWPPSDLYTEKVQSFYPSCVRPKNTDEELWNNPDLMHLFFDLKYSEPAEGLTSDIVTAKLRLYKISKDIKTSQNETSNVSTPSSSELAEEEEEEEEEEEVPSTTYNTATDDIIRVSVYYYTRSLKKNRVKKRILDTRMLPILGDEWTEFNVGPAAKSWKETGKNHGLVVHVEDEYGQLMTAHDHFSPMDCTNEASATARPLPGFIVTSGNALQWNKHTHPADNGAQAAAAGPNQDSALYFNTFMFPMMDVCTAEIPEQDAIDSALKHLDGEAASLTASTTPHAAPQDDEDMTGTEGQPRQPPNFDGQATDDALFTDVAVSAVHEQASSSTLVD